MAKYIDIEKEIAEMQQVVEFYKDNETFEAEITSFAFQAIIDKLTQVPAEDVAPVAHAKITIGDDGFVRCSACNKTIRYPLTSFSDIEYCPRCGAKVDMKG